MPIFLKDKTRSITSLDQIEIPKLRDKYKFYKEFLERVL